MPNFLTCGDAMTGERQIDACDSAAQSSSRRGRDHRRPAPRGPCRRLLNSAPIGAAVLRPLQPQSSREFARQLESLLGGSAGAGFRLKNSGATYLCSPQSKTRFDK